jgi:excisionase family DNA binding protein
MLENYMSTQDAASAIGITYETLMARIRRGKIKAEKIGWNKVIHRDEVKRAKKDQQDVVNKSMEESTR